MRASWAAIALGTALAAPAYAQPVAATQARDSVARGLEAQFRSAIIRERRLADERQLRLLTNAEDRMRTARQRLASAQSDRAAAQAELDAAREAFAALVESVPLAVAEARIQAEVFRAEVSGTLAQATPELRAAYEEFSDGDRRSAWTTLAPLLQAQARARSAAARAVAGAEMRQLASLREIMRSNGEATIADVLPLWVAAAEIDPSDTWTHIQRARLARQMGDRAQARVAYLAAMPTTTNDYDRGVLANEAASMLLDEGEFAAAFQLQEAAAEVSRRYLAQNPFDTPSWISLAFTLSSMARGKNAQGDYEGAQRAHEEALRIRRMLARSNPGVDSAQDDLSFSLTSVADGHFRRNDYATALPLYEESLVIRRARVAAAPSNLERLDDLAFVLLRIGAVKDRTAYNQPENLVQARALYEEAADITRRIAAADRTDLARQHALAEALHLLAQIHARERNHSQAAPLDEEAIAIMRTLVAADPRSTAFNRDLADGLRNYAHTQIALRNLPRARSNAEEAVRLGRASDLSVVTNQSDLANSLNTLGNVLLAMDDFAPARASHTEALAIYTRLAQANPTNRMYTNSVAFSQQQVDWVNMRENTWRQNRSP